MKEALGGWGERRAAAVLQAKGFRVLACNWRSPRDKRYEIDLVCEDHGVCVFVEVKTRRAGALVRGLGSVNGRKRLALRRAVRAYLEAGEAQGCRPKWFRCDVVEVEHGAGGQVYHFENYPLLRERFW